jgi:SRSO17 transposase
MLPILLQWHVVMELVTGEGMGMDIGELRRLRVELDAFAGQFDDCIKTRRSRDHFRTYMSGQLGPLERKSVEPIALEAGVPPRSLQEFLSIHRWDDTAAGRRLHELARRDHSDPNAIGVIDETSFAKKGDKTAGVQRQHCGATGKTDNCVVTVHLGCVSKEFHALLGGDVYLPEKTWMADRARCREAGIPAGVVYRPKWRIALDLLADGLGHGVWMPWLTADEDYGRASSFRDTVSQWGMTYVVEIPTCLSGWVRLPKVEPVGTVTASGRTLSKPRVAPGQREASQVGKLWKHRGPSWARYRIKDTQKGPVVWEVRESRFYPNRDGVPGEEHRLIVARNVLTGEVKYFLSNAGWGVPLKTLLFVAFSRWHIERLFEDGKGEVGLDHFEVRNYRSLKRHLLLSALSLYFLCEQTNRLREKKLVVDAMSGQSDRGGPAGLDDVAASATATSGESGRQDFVLAAT